MRDRALFVGNPDDVVDEPFGPDLPMIRDWTREHYDFAGYVAGFDPAELADRDALRAELGFAPDERVCVVAVGGSGVGESLLRRVIAAHPPRASVYPTCARSSSPDRASTPTRCQALEGLEVRAYVHNLYRHLAACDLAVVQGGLTTAMELTANRRPFLYFPLKHHFEQRLHVAHRLDRYGAGRRMEYDESPPDVIAEAIAEEIGREVDYVRSRPAARAAPPSGSRRCCHVSFDPSAPAMEPEPRRLRRARRRPHLLRGLRRRPRAHDCVPADVVDRALADMARPARVLRAPPPRRAVRRPRQRALGPPGRPGRLPPDRVLPRRARGHGRHGDRAGDAGLALSWDRALLAARGGASRAGRRNDLGRLRRCPAAGRAAPTRRQGVRTQRESYEGWEKLNANYWLEHHEEFLEFFFSHVFCEPHSTKQIEDAVGWGLATDPETLIATQLAPRVLDEEGVRALTGEFGGRSGGPRNRRAVRPHARGAAWPSSSADPVHQSRGVRPQPGGAHPGEDEPPHQRLRRVARRAMSTLVRERTASPTEPSRARYPDETGFAEREGVRLNRRAPPATARQRFPFLAPTPISQSRAWKAQIPYLARHHRVVVYDCRGNGKSDRPRGVDAYRTEEMARDALAVMDASGTQRGVVARLSAGRARTALGSPPTAPTASPAHGLHFRALPAGDPLATRSRPCARRTWSRGRGSVRRG